MAIVGLAGLAIAVGIIVGLIDRLLAVGATFDRDGSAAQVACNRRRRASSIPCRRCVPHQHCYAVTWCDECDEWMCMQCWFACTVGAPAQRETSQHHWNDPTLEIARAAGPQPDGSYVLFCGAEEYFAHEDGGHLLPQPLS